MTLSSLCDLIVDCEHKTAPTVAAGYPLIRTPDIGVGRLHVESAQRVDEATYRAWTKRSIPRAGDLILAREAPVGNVGIVRPGVQPVLGQRTVLIRPRPDVLDPYYLNYLMSGPELRGWMDGVSSGATVPHLNMADIRSMELPHLPPIATQRKVAAILSTYDDLIESNKRRVTLLEEMAQRIYREWFIDFRYPGHENVSPVDSELGPIPEGWRVGRWGQYATLDYGRALRGHKENTGQYPVFGTNGQIGWYSEALFPPGVVVGRKGAYRGIHLSPDPCWVIDTAFYLRLSENARIDSMYSYYQLRTVDLDEIDSGSAIPSTSRDAFYAIPIIVPPTELVRKFSTFAGDLDTCQRALTKGADNLRATRDLLLPHLISGEIDVTDLDIAMPQAAA